MKTGDVTEQVWCGRGFRPKRGSLILRSGRLVYSSEEAVVFDVPLPEIERLHWPWYSFSTAFDVAVHGKRYYLSFLGTGNTSRTWMRGVLAGRRWRQLLTEALATGDSRALKTAARS